MTFRELLKKYKDGTLSNEEKLLVERELEKSEAINDYLADEIEKSLAMDSNRNYEISDENNTKQNKEIERSIKKTVTKRLVMIVAASVSMVFVIILIIQYIVSPLVSSQYYNPTKKTSGQSSLQDLVFDLRGITEVSMPGYITSFNANAVDLGFGNYNLTFQSQDLFTREKKTGNTQLIKGRHTVFFEDFYPYHYFSFSEFGDDEEGTNRYYNTLEIKKHFSEREIEHVKDLPSTSYISAWARFTNDLTMEELYKVMLNYREINFEWIAVRTAKKQGQQLMGFLTDNNIGSSTDSVDKEKYPGFQLTDIWNLSGSTPPEVQMSKIYETHFTSLLKYLVDRHQAVDALLPMSINYDYESALNFVEKNGISTYGVLLYGEAADLLELYESGVIMTFDIDNVIVSKYIH